MIRKSKLSLALAAIALAACESSDRLAPGPEGPSESSPQFAIAAPAGIAFASWGLQPSLMSSVHTGAVGGATPSGILTYLGQVKSKGGRVVLNLGRDARNADGTFSLTKWKTLIDQYRGINLGPYITDGTLVGHFVVDEPHFKSRWGGKIIPQSTVEAMAKYSKQVWPTLTTIVNAPPSWLAASTIAYTYLDAGWAIFRSVASDNPSRWIASQVAAAKGKGLGVFAGLNVLDGGDGSSGFHGNLSGKWAMSAAELTSYGTALLSQTYICGFAMWKYTSTYYGRSDVKSAMAGLSTKAKNHAKTSCRQ